MASTVPCVIDGVESQRFEWTREDVFDSYALVWKPQQFEKADAESQYKDNRNRRCYNPWYWLEKERIESRVAYPIDGQLPPTLKAYPVHSVFTSLDDAKKMISDLIGCDCEGVFMTDANRSFIKILYDVNADDGFVWSERTSLSENAATFVDDIMKHDLEVVLLVAGNSHWFRKVNTGGSTRDGENGETIERTSVIKINHYRYATC